MMLPDDDPGGLTAVHAAAMMAAAPGAWEAMFAVPATAEGLSRARREAMAAISGLSDPGAAALVGEAALIVSELAANCHLHAGGGGADAVVRLAAGGGLLVIAVADAGPRRPRVPGMPSPWDTCGRGMALVSALAREAGGSVQVPRLRGGGKEVVVRLPLPGRGRIACHSMIPRGRGLKEAINMSSIDTDGYSARLRKLAVDQGGRRLLVTDLRGSEQEGDLAEPVNCGGFGRIRHFTTATSPGWPANPLPASPAAAALGIEPQGALRAQVFQNAACNWRCWYCFVPFSLLSANPARSRWLTAGQMVDAWLDQADPPRVIDLSGGQPDLVPEWTAWMIEELAGRGLLGEVFVWGDDNLSTDYFFRHLTAREQDLIASCRRYGRVCCFKGFDEESFAFSTAAGPALFAGQFELFRRLAATGMDLYAYATFTTADPRQIPARIARFIDRLQGISPLLPLRLVPLEIQVWGPVAPRMRPDRDRALCLQHEAVAAWNTEMTRRFTAADRALPIHQIPLNATEVPR